MTFRSTKQLKLPSSFADEADREIIAAASCRAGAHCRVLLSLLLLRITIRTHKLFLIYDLHEPFPTSRRNFTFYIAFTNCIAHQHHLKGNPTRASLPAYHTRSLRAITSLLENICFQEHPPTPRILHHSHYATNLHPGAHQDHQKTFIRHAS